RNRASARTRRRASRGPQPCPPRARPPGAPGTRPSEPPSWLLHLQHLVRRNVLHRLCLSAGPTDLDTGFARRAQSEVQGFVVRRKIASRRGGVTVLTIHFHFGAKAVAVAMSADQINVEPVVGVAGVAKDHGSAAQDGHDDGDETVSVEVPESGAATGDEADTGNRDALEF